MGLHTSQVRRYLLAAAISQVFVVAPALALPAQTNQTLSDDQTIHEKPSEKKQEPITLKTVVVTAQRRKQNIQDVPLSMTAFTHADLDRRNISNITDLSGAAPSLVVNKSAGGWMTHAEVSIRGGNVGVGTPVAVYVNGIYVGPSSTYIFDLPDLERIEVLRGPQGTLYGGNAMDGAINLITKTPSGQFTGTATLGYGKYNHQLGKLAVDLPAWGRLKVSVGGRYEREDGWVSATAPRRTPNLAASTAKDGFVAIRFDATDNLKIDYRYDNANTHGTTVFNQALASNVEQAFGIPGIVVNNDRQTTAAVNNPVAFRQLSTSQALTVTWTPSASTTLKYLFGHRSVGGSSGLDLDGSPILFAQNFSYSQYRQTSNEIQYLGEAGRWNWVAGLYQLNTDSSFVNPQTFLLGAYRLLSMADTGNSNRAAYGQVNYKVTDKLTATAGIRRTVSKVNASASLTSGPFALVPPGTHAAATFSATTPMASVKYQFDRDNMVYLRYAKGFMSGGFNVQASTASGVRTPYNPETAQTFEIGTKNALFGRRVTLDADVFYDRITNLQENVFTAVNSATSTILNAGKANKYGFELQATWRPTSNLTFGVTYSYLRAKYKEFMDSGVNVANNRAFTLLPKNMVGLTASTVLARTSNGVLRADVDYRYSAAYYRYPDPLVATSPGAVVASDTKIGAYGRLNAQLLLSGVSLLDGRIYGDVVLWVDNVTNASHIYNKIDFGPSFGSLIVGNYNQPRTFGLRVTARW